MEAIQSFDFICFERDTGFAQMRFSGFFTVFISYLTTSGIIWIAAGKLLDSAVGCVLLCRHCINCTNNRVCFWITGQAVLC